MLKISRAGKTLDRLENPNLASVSITERYDLQEYIFNSPSDFFAEIGDELFVIGKEVQPSSAVQDRIDILAVDRDGVAVIVELKRGSHKLQLLQAVAYAGMVSQWETEEFTRRYEARLDELSDWLEVDLHEVNRRQRVLLIAEDFDYEVLIGAEWLYEKYNVEIACARLAVAVDSATGAEYLSCTQIFPPPELAEQAKSRSRGVKALAGTLSWEDHLSRLQNAEVVEFVKRQLEKGCEQRITDRKIFFRLQGKRRFTVEVQMPHATVRQTARFPRDIEFWRDRLSSQAVDPVEHGEWLRFFLKTSADCSAFLAALPELEALEWDPSASGDTSGDEVPVLQDA